MDEAWVSVVSPSDPSAVCLFILRWHKGIMTPGGCSATLARFLKIGIVKSSTENTVNLIPPFRRSSSQPQMLKAAGLSMTATPPSVTAVLITSCVYARRYCWGRKLVRCLSRPTPESAVSTCIRTCSCWCRGSCRLLYLFISRLISRRQRRAGGIRRQRSRFDPILHWALPRRGRAAGGRPAGDEQKRRPLLVLMDGWSAPEASIIHSTAKWSKSFLESTSEQSKLKFHTSDKAIRREQICQRHQPRSNIRSTFDYWINTNQWADD